MEIRGFLGNSFLDYPGHPAAVVWTPGCNFRCPFCHNRELVLEPGSLPRLEAGEALERLAREAPFIDGVVVTGGEPTIQPGLADFLRRAGKIGLLRKLDTNGSQPGVIARLLEAGLVDYLAVDIKAPLDDPALYGVLSGLGAAVAGVPARVRECAALAMDGGLDHEFRTTVVPGLLEEEGVLATVASFARIGLGRPGRFVIQNFFPAPVIDPALVAGRPLPAERLRKLGERAAPFCGQVLLRGESAD